MKYEKGNLILSDSERELLTLGSMLEIDAQYSAPYFVGSMAEIKAGCEARIVMIQSKQDPDERDPARISLLYLLIDVCDLMIERGIDAAETANETIRLQ